MQPYLLAASGCVREGEIVEFWDHSLRRHWLRTTASAPELARGFDWEGVTLEARMHLEEQERARGLSRLCGHVVPFTHGSSIPGDGGGR